MDNAKKPERTEFDLTWHTEKPRCGTLGIKNGGAVANIQYWLSGKTDSEITKKIGEYLLNACNSHDAHVAEKERLVEALEFYANINNYDGDHAPGNLVGYQSDQDKWETDKGEIARQALRTVGEVKS